MENKMSCIYVVLEYKRCFKITELKDYDTYDYAREIYRGDFDKCNRYLNYLISYYPLIEFVNFKVNRWYSEVI